MNTNKIGQYFDVYILHIQNKHELIAKHTTFRNFYPFHPLKILKWVKTPGGTRGWPSRGFILFCLFSEKQ